MLSSKKKNKRSRRILEEAAIYSEDIGTLGIKKTAGGASSYQKPISSLPLPDDEDKRRLQRMVNSCGLQLVIQGPVSIVLFSCLVAVSSRNALAVLQMANPVQCPLRCRRDVLMKRYQVRNGRR